MYIKQHSITGKLYFGKTTRNHHRMVSYSGSGNHWLNHINKHGKEFVTTIWYCLFLDQKNCTEFAINFSEQQNIVESEEWLNMIPENGLTGGLPKGANKGTKSVHYGKTPSQGTKNKMARAKLGKPSYQKSVKIEHIIFPSIKAASLHFNVVPSTITLWIKKQKAVLLTNAPSVELHLTT